MRRLVVSALVLACSVSVTPGVREGLIDALHYAIAGHEVHAEACADGESDEHGCTGLFHACGCHGTVLMAPPSTQPRVSARVALAAPRYTRLEPTDGPRGHARQILRPPTA